MRVGSWERSVRATFCRATSSECEFAADTNESCDDPCTNRRTGLLFRRVLSNLENWNCDRLTVAKSDGAYSGAPAAPNEKLCATTPCAASAGESGADTVTASER